MEANNRYIQLAAANIYVQIIDALHGTTTSSERISIMLNMVESTSDTEDRLCLFARILEEIALSLSC